MRFANLQHQVIADTVEAWLAENNPKAAWEEFQKLPQHVAESAEGLFWKFKVQLQIDNDAALETLAKAKREYPDHNWVNIFFAVITASHGLEEHAIGSLVLIRPRLENWAIALQMAEFLHARTEERASKYFKCALDMAPAYALNEIKERSNGIPLFQSLLKASGH